MNRGGFAWRLVGVVGVCLGWSALRLAAQEMSAPEFPVDAYKKNDKGIVVVQAKFDRDGKVEACTIVRSNAPYSLEVDTVDYVRRQWINRWFAGETVAIPITFDELPWNATRWNDDLVPPPNMLSPGDPGRSLKLRIAFGKDSWVERVQVLEPSGIGLVDRQTEIWVKVHWHNEAFAGQTLDTPFVFKPVPAKTKTAAAPAPTPKRKPAPSGAAVPTQPESPPAVRVQ